MSKIVLGSTFGDEGKGITVDWLCSQSKNPMVVRFSGGQQAGHMVVSESGLSHIFSGFGSGTLRGVPTYWSEFCTIDPIHLMSEYTVLKSKGITPKLFIDMKCPVTTPYEVFHNVQLEKFNQHGTCGFGIGQTWQREQDHYSLLVEDMFFEEIFLMKFANIIGHYYKFGVTDEYLNKFKRCVKEMMNNPDFIFVRAVPQVDEKCEEYNYIFEGSQGLLLDKDNGFFPNVTRSNTGMVNALHISDLADDDIEDVFLVTRAYQTRHGNGPMTNEEYRLCVKDNPNECNKANPHQGTFRKTVLDLNLIQYAIMKEPYLAYRDVNLVVTCLDQLNKYQFTCDGILRQVETEDEFLDAIAKELDGRVTGIYTSHSNVSNNITKK